MFTMCESLFDTFPPVNFAEARCAEIWIWLRRSAGVREMVGMLGRRGFLVIGNAGAGIGVGFLIMGAGRSGEDEGTGAAAAKARIEKNIKDRMMKGVLG